MRLIDADALKETVKNERFSGWGNCCVEIDDAPTVDAVPVVRCGECIHNKSCTWSEPDWYCADGERKEQNDG